MITNNINKQALCKRLLTENKITIEEMFLLLEIDTSNYTSLPIINIPPIPYTNPYPTNPSPFWCGSTSILETGKLHDNPNITYTSN